MIYKKNIYYQSHQSHHARFALANRFDTIRRSEHARTAFSRERREWLPIPLFTIFDGRTPLLFTFPHLQCSNRRASSPSNFLLLFAARSALATFERGSTYDMRAVTSCAAAIFPAPHAWGESTFVRETTFSRGAARARACFLRACICLV